MSLQMSRTLRLVVPGAVFLLPLIAQAQVALPEIVVTSPTPIVRPSDGTGTQGDNLQGTLPIVTDQFATVTVVPNAELRRNGAATLGDLLFEKPGITGSSFARRLQPADYPWPRYRPCTNSGKMGSAQTARRISVKIISCRSIL